MGPQSRGSPNFGNFRTPSWESWDKMTFWVLVLWPSAKYIIRGKVVASPKFGPWWVLWVRVCIWFVYAPRCFNYTLTNLLFGLFRSSWVIKSLVNVPSPHPGALAHPFTFEVLQAKERAPTLSPFVVFTFGLLVESIKELGGVSLTPFQVEQFPLCCSPLQHSKWC
jgi:hypothetical protein